LYIQYKRRYTKCLTFSSSFSIVRFLIDINANWFYAYVKPSRILNLRTYISTSSMLVALFFLLAGIKETRKKNVYGQRKRKLTRIVGGGARGGGGRGGGGGGGG
jgi:uncharacterized membrane protein YgcG